MLDAALIRERVYLLADDVDPRVTQHVHGWLDYYDDAKGRQATPGQGNTGTEQPRRPKGVPGARKWTSRERPEGDVIL